MFAVLLATLTLGATAPVESGFDDRAERGWHRGGLRLTPGRSLHADLREPLGTDLGALAFWIQPQEAGRGPSGSYAILTARWDDVSQGYLAVSQGWWEPLGRGRFHAVISNHDGAYCATDRPLVEGRWTHVVVSWRGRSPGYCRIYFDGELAAAGPMTIATSRRARPRLALGSDREASDRRGRDADGTLDELQHFPEGLSDTQVRSLYERAVPDAGERRRRAFDWAQTDRASTADQAPARETRMLLDESWQWARSPADVRHLVEVARRAGFNVIVPCVWHGRGTAWPSTVGHRQAELATALDRFDPLELLITEAHRVGIEVHPWFTVVRREDEQHPEWFDAGTPAGAYDVHRPAFRDFMVTLVEELVRRYEVDGVNLDYIRAMGVCRSDSCAKSYAAATGRSLAADLPHSNVAGPARAAIERWQDDALRELVSDIRARIRAVRPRARLSVSGHPVPRDGLRALEGRAETQWHRLGLIDAILAMEYGAVPRHDNVAAVARDLGDPAALVWVFANFDRLDGAAVARPADYLAEYLRFGRRRVPGSGLAVYLRAMLNPAQIEALAQGPFRDRVPAALPDNTP